MHGLNACTRRPISVTRARSRDAFLPPGPDAAVVTTGSHYNTALTTRMSFQSTVPSLSASAALILSRLSSFADVCVGMAHRLKAYAFALTDATVAMLVTMHEIGHNFGANHDADPGACSPSCARSLRDVLLCCLRLA